MDMLKVNKWGDETRYTVANKIRNIVSAYIATGYISEDEKKYLLDLALAIDNN